MLDASPWLLASPGCRPEELLPLESCDVESWPVDPTLGARLAALGYDADIDTVRRAPRGTDVTGP
ncbi:MAG: hypothetical protein EOO67_18050, partial [Microbacterium sp.]